MSFTAVFLSNNIMKDITTAVVKLIPRYSSPCSFTSLPENKELVIRGFHFPMNNVNPYPAGEYIIKSCMKSSDIFDVNINKSIKGYTRNETTRKLLKAEILYFYQKEGFIDIEINNKLFRPSSYYIDMYTSKNEKLLTRIAVFEKNADDFINELVAYKNAFAKEMELPFITTQNSIERCVIDIFNNLN